MAEFLANSIIFILVWGGVSTVFFGLGLSQLNSKNPVTFYTGETPLKPQQLTDVSGWNRAHGWLWIGFSIVFLLTGVLFAVVGYLELLSTPLQAVVLLLGLMGAELGGLVLCHSRLIKKYKIN